LPRPGALTQLSALGAKAFLQARATYLGNYPEGGGSVKATECRLCLATSLMRRQQQHGIVLLTLLVLGGAGLGIAVLRRRTAGTTSHSFAITALFLDGIVTVQFLTATYGEAVETTKHLVIAVLAGLLHPKLPSRTALAGRHCLGEAGAPSPLGRRRAARCPPAGTARRVTQLDGGGDGLPAGRVGEQDGELARPPRRASMFPSRSSGEADADLDEQLVTDMVPLGPGCR
jgi:hypothetical protein